MPVQINEIVIRANIIEKAEKETAYQTPLQKEINKEEIIRECTELILELIHNQNER